MADPTPEALRIGHGDALDARVERLKASRAAWKSARGGMILLADALEFWGVAADATEADKLAAIKRTEETVNSRPAPAVLAGLHMYLLDQFLCDVSQLAHAQRRCAAAKRRGRARVELPTPALVALLAEIERLRAIEAALDADASPTAPCLLCGSHGPRLLVASRRGSFWLCEDAAACRARKGGAK